MTIWAFSCDPGGTAGMLPVVRELKKKKEKVLYFAYGKAREILSNEQENFLGFNSANDIISMFADHHWPSAFVTSMCSKDQIARDLIKLFTEVCPSVALQDYWGARLASTWKDTRPDHICVNDAVGKEIVETAWPDFYHENIQVLGYPALDQYVDFDIEEIKMDVKKDLQLKEKPIVLFGGQGSSTGKVFKELIETLNGIGEEVYLLPRAHPRMKEDYPQEISEWEGALDLFKAGEIIETSEYKSIQPLIAASTVVVSMYSTVLVEASTLRISNISMLYPDAGMVEFRKGTGGIIDEFPLTKLGCSAKASNRVDLTESLESSFQGDLKKKLNPAQDEYFKLDGQNAKRVAEFVLSLTEQER
ncbi:CDP-glycerol glycerophosphotransferase family protein [Patescibacteria group bacterium]